MSLLDGMKDSLSNPLADAMESEMIADEEEFYIALEESLGIDDDDLDDDDDGLNGVAGVPGSMIDAEDDELLAGLVSDSEAEALAEDPELGEDLDDINFGNDYESEDVVTLEQLVAEMEGTMSF